MSNKLIFPIVIHPNATKLENISGFFLVAFIFIPFIYGLFTEQLVYCLSLVLGSVGVLIFNVLTDGKFTLSKIIQKNKLISFNENEVTIRENNECISHNWDNLEAIELYIIAYKNKRKDEDSEDSGVYSGIENYVLFTFEKITYKHLFYVENQTDFNCLSDYFENIILPKLYQLKNIKNESILISGLDYSALQKFKRKYNINRYTDFIHFN